MPVQELSAAARREKKGHPPTYQMHYWWTRKPLIIARAAILASIFPAGTDPTLFYHLLGLGNRDPPYLHGYAPEELEAINSAADSVAGPILMLDPFAGGGAIPFEALRAGISCVAADLNPVAWLIEKVTLEFPLTLGLSFMPVLKQYLREVVGAVSRDMGEFYPSDQGRPVLAYVYAWEVPCPACGVLIPLVNSWMLVKKPASKHSRSAKEVFLAPHYDGVSGCIEVRVQSSGHPPPGNCRRARGECLNPACKARIPNEWIREQIRDHPRERLLAVVEAGDDGKIYCTPSPEQFGAVASAERAWSESEGKLREQGVVPGGNIPPDPRAATAYLYLRTWDQVANPRQRLALAHLVLAIREGTRHAIHDLGPEKGKAIGMYLACLLGKHLNRNCRLTTWDVQGEKIVHACSNKLNALQWNHLEINPFAPVSGSLDYSARDIRRGYKFATAALWPGGTCIPASIQITNCSVFSLQATFPGPFNIIITDPPYFDDAPYGEISEFFFAWEVCAIGGFLLDENPAFATHLTPKDDDISASRVRGGSHFSELLAQACQIFYHQLSDDGRLVMFFAHSAWEAWLALLRALTGAGFQITATWPVHTESIGITNTGKSSSLSSIIVVARKQDPVLRNASIDVGVNVVSLLSARINARLPFLWSFNLRGLDLFAATTGVALETLSAFLAATNLENSGLLDTIPSLTWKLVVQFTLQQYGTPMSNITPQIAFAVFFRTNQMTEIPLAYAELIAQTVGTTLTQLEQDGIICRKEPHEKHRRSIRLQPASIT